MAQFLSDNPSRFLSAFCSFIGLTALITLMASVGGQWLHISIAVVAYPLPAAIAFNRGHHNTLAISVLNVWLGWAVIGWFVALVWACTQTRKRIEVPPNS
jgi:hypothetical protein